MKKLLAVGLVLVLLAGVLAVAQTTVAPRVYNVLLFDNQTGIQATKLAIVFDKAVSFDASNIVVIGGGAATGVAITQNMAFINVVVQAGGTLQLVLPPDSAGAVVTAAYWFK